MVLLSFDATRLVPVVVVAAVFWTVWKLLRGTRHSTALAGHFVEVHVAEDAGEARALAEYLCEQGFTAVANEEPGPRSPATLSRARGGDPRPFVAVREEEVAEAVPVIAEYLVAASEAVVGQTADETAADETAANETAAAEPVSADVRLDEALDDEPFSSGTMRFVRGVGPWLVTALVAVVVVFALVRAFA
ncbi:MAG: hypothetical protein AB8H80_07015 [Planctomycetota bacterium]